MHSCGSSTRSATRLAGIRGAAPAQGEMGMTARAVVFLPVLVPSVANLREHWRTRAARAKQHRAWAHNLLRCNKDARELEPGRMRITLTRVAPRALDSDNLAASCKNLRDGVADFLGIDDGSAALEWVYAARKPIRGNVGVEILLECLPDASERLRLADQGAQVSDKVPDVFA